MLATPAILLWSTTCYPHIMLNYVRVDHLPSDAKHVFDY